MNFVIWSLQVLLVFVSLQIRFSVKTKLIFFFIGNWGNHYFCEFSQFTMIISVVFGLFSAILLDLPLFSSFLFFPSFFSPPTFLLYLLLFVSLLFYINLKWRNANQQPNGHSVTLEHMTSSVETKGIPGVHNRLKSYIRISQDKPSLCYICKSYQFYSIMLII